MRQIKPAIIIFVLLTLITGVVYPLVVTGVAQAVFPAQANGNFILVDGKPVGSLLIGQPFSDPTYFWGRLSATSPAYNSGLSSGSNLGPTNSVLLDKVKERVKALRTVDPDNTKPIPIDLVTASGSGLDPDISLASAYYQIPRIAKERGLQENEINALVKQSTQDRQFGIFGEPRVNVLNLNLVLDSYSTSRKAGGPALDVDSSHLVQKDTSSIFGIRMIDWIQFILFFGVLFTLVVPIGGFMARMYRGEKTIVSPLMDPLERWVLKAAGVRTDEEMNWRTFAGALMIFNILGIIVVFLIQSIQQYLPLNPLGLGPVAPDLALNTAVSFATNTNWQAYAGETTLSYLTQMIALTVQNFVSAATGMAVLVALIYGFTRKHTDKIGNFWILLLRSVWVLIPLCIVFSLILVSQGSVQNVANPITVPLLDPITDNGTITTSTQTIPQGPAASQIAIKMIGTNGGGFFNVNSAHPYENPTPLSNLLTILAELLIPASLCYSFGSMIGSVRKGLAILIAMTIILIPLIGICFWYEQSGNPLLSASGVDQTTSNLQPGGNMEGKEIRFGILSSVLFAVSTTATSCGAVNSMHDSFTPLGGMIPLIMMQFGEVVFGGTGSGLYIMIVYVIIAMFIAGLMVGRTPEYLGKKIEPMEMTLAAIIILIPIAAILIGAAIASITDAGISSVFNPGAHGLSEILYAFTSAVANNGSAFGGLGSNTLFYNIGLAIAMFVGRYPLAILTLALAGSFAYKKIVPPSEATLQDHRPLFIVWLVFVVIMIGVLSFLPALALGPIAEYLIQGGMFHV